MPKVVLGPNNDVHKTLGFSQADIVILGRPGVSSIVGMSVCGTKQPKRLTVDYVRSTLKSRHLSGNVCFMAVFVCFGR